MRLCFVGNPGSIHTQRWVGHFAEAGHQVHLVNLGPQLGRKFDWPGPQHHNLPAQPGVPVPGLRGVLMLTARRRALAALLEQIQPDILHAHAIVDPAWFAALSGFHPLVLTAWGSDVLLGLQQAPWLNRWLTRYALRHADLLTADARVVLDAAQPHLRPATPTALIRFGVDTRVFSPGADTTWRARLALGSDPLLLSIRQCHPLYNIDVIIRAFAHVREELPAARLVVKLVSQDADDPYLAEMRALAGQLALGDAIVYVPQVELCRDPRPVSGRGRRDFDAIVGWPAGQRAGSHGVRHAGDCQRFARAARADGRWRRPVAGAGARRRGVESRHPGPAGRSRATGRRSPPRTWQPSAAPPTSVSR